MEKTKTKRKWWEPRGDGTPPTEYEECYLRALRRMAVALNCNMPSTSAFSPSFLKKSDLELRAIFSTKKIGSGDANAALVNHELIHRGALLEDFDQAENLFYGDFEFNCPRGFKGIVRVTHRSTPAFRKWSFQQLRWPTIEVPQGGPAFLKKRPNETDSEFMMTCASNYLLKNFWHNYVHRNIQGIASHNYHDFGGQARDHSDFTADNLGTILFARSYGVDILTSGRSGTNRSDAIHDLLSRNRCNLVFAERDRRRIEKTAQMDVLNRWQEAHWQFRRRLAMAISNQLIERGASVTSLAVYLRGERQTREGWFFHDQNVVVEVNGKYFVGNHVPYIPDPAKPMKPQTRKKAYERREELATSFVGQYTTLLEQTGELRAYAKQSLSALAERIGISL